MQKGKIFSAFNEQLIKMPFKSFLTICHLSISRNPKIYELIEKRRKNKNSLVF